MPVDLPKPLSLSNACVIAKGDSGATHHYWRAEDSNCLQNINTNKTTNATLPNSKVIGLTAQDLIPLSNQLSQQAKDDIVLPDLKSSSLISLGQLCDDNCVITLDKKALEVRNNNELVIKGTINMKD